MIVYRIAKIKYANDLSGTGARLYGGRWNHKGISIVYTSESRSLAILEFLAHATQSVVPEDTSMISIEIAPGITPQKLKPTDLPNNWKTYPAPLKLMDIGTKWALSGETLLLRVPSVVVEHEYNILINCAHPDIQRVKISNIEKFALDERLFNKK